MNYLVTIWDAGGSVPPELALARRLVAAGHRVVVLAGPPLQPAVEAAGASFRSWQRVPHRRHPSEPEPFTDAHLTRPPQIVPGVGRLHRIHRQRPDRVHRQLVDRPIRRLRSIRVHGHLTNPLRRSVCQRAGANEGRTQHGTAITAALPRPNRPGPTRPPPRATIPPKSGHTSDRRILGSWALSLDPGSGGGLTVPPAAPRAARHPDLPGRAQNAPTRARKPQESPRHGRPPSDARAPSRCDGARASDGGRPCRGDSWGLRARGWSVLGAAREVRGCRAARGAADSASNRRRNRVREEKARGAEKCTPV